MRRLGVGAVPVGPVGDADSTYYADELWETMDEGALDWRDAVHLFPLWTALPLQGLR